MPKKTTKKTTKTRKPLTISIHGEDLDIEAEFRDGDLSEVLANTINRVNGAATKSPSAQSPIADLVTELAKSLRTDQVEVLNNTFDMAQKTLFMEIMNSTKHAHDHVS